MWFRVLGPLEVRAVSGRACTFSTRMQRELLAALLLARGRPMAADRLIDWLWDGRPPASAVRNLYSYVSVLRRRLSEDTESGPRIVKLPGGYAIRLEPGELDAERFEQLAADGAAAAAANRPEAAVERFTEALGLWRSESVLEGLQLPEPMQAEAARLEELRRSVFEANVDARLTLGQQVELVPELELMVRRDPLRERLWGQLMLALHRSARRADALSAYRRAREVLRTELGVEPGAGLKRLHGQILGADPSVSAPPLSRPASQRPVPAQLPAVLSTFTGRRAEIVELGAPAPAGAARTATICGAGGVGKSTLAIQVAHQLSEQFPDGQLYVDLRGSTAGTAPLEPLEVLGRFLRALGVPGPSVPGQLDAAAERFRSELAGRRVLIVLDNASDFAQVRPLLPVVPTCRAIVTSRRDLHQLDDAVRIRLDVFSEREAVDLLSRIVGRDRLAADPGAAAQVAELCGRLPLAIRIAAARLVHRPAWRLATLADRLADAHGRLDVLERSEAGVRTSLSISYEELRRGDELDRAAARMFTLLGVWDGTELGLPAAARLAELSGRSTEQLLEHLADVALLERPSPGRYRMHDMLRLYGRELAAEHHTQPEREAALRRVIGHYTSNAWHALEVGWPGDRRLLWRQASWASGSDERWFDTPEAALGWLDSERANVLTSLQQAARSGLEEAALQLAHAVYLYLLRNGHWQDWEQAGHTALEAARGIGAPGAQAQVHNDLAVVYEMRGMYAEGVEHLRRSLDLHQELGDVRGQASGLANLGIAYSRQGHDEQALRCLRESLELGRELNEPAGESRTLQNLGLVCARLGMRPEALAYLERGLAICLELGDRLGEAISLGCLGYVHKEFGQLDAALDCLGRSLRLNEEAGDRLGQAVDLNNLGAVHHARLSYASALDCHERSLAICREIGHRAEEAEALHHAGLALAALGRFAEARERWVAALALYDELRLPAAAEVRGLLAGPVA